MSGGAATNDLEAIARVLEALADGDSHTWRATWPGPGPAPPAWSVPPAVQATASTLDLSGGPARVWDLQGAQAHGVLRALVADAAVAAWMIWAWTEGWLALAWLARAAKEDEG